MNRKYYYSFKSGTKYPIDATPPIEDGPYGIFPTFERAIEIVENLNKKIDYDIYTSVKTSENIE